MRDAPRPVLACLGATLAVFTAAAAMVLVSYGRGYFDGGYEVTAMFPASGQGLFTDGGSEVKMRGVGIGTVSGIDLLPDGRARFTLLLEEDAQIPVTASASIEPLSLFGPKFVEIIPGDAEGGGPFLAPGDEITETTITPELTRLLDRATSLLSTIDPMEVAATFDAVSKGVSGLGDDIGESIDAGSNLISVAHKNRDLAQKFLGDLAVVSSTLASRSASFVDSIDDLRALAAVTNDHRGDLGGLLETARAVAARGGGLVELTAADFDLAVRSIATVVGTVYEQRELVPAAVDTVGAFFKMLSDPMRLPGPDGTKLTALKGFITVDLCLVYGICVLPDGSVIPPPPGPETPTPPPTPGVPVPPLPDIPLLPDIGLISLADLLLEPVAASGGPS